MDFSQMSFNNWKRWLLNRILSDVIEFHLFSKEFHQGAILASLSFGEVFLIPMDLGANMTPVL